MHQKSAPETNVDSAISAMSTKHAAAAVRAIAKHCQTVCWRTEQDCCGQVVRSQLEQSSKDWMLNLDLYKACAGQAGAGDVGF
jgi:hypothetical protein